MKKLLIALALLFVPSLAWAQCNGVFLAGQVCGSSAGGVPGPSTFASFGPITIGGLVINTTSNTLNQGLVINQAPGTAIGTANFNVVNINSDFGNANTGFNVGMQVIHGFGNGSGGTMQGNRIAFAAIANLNAAASSSDVSAKQYIGGQFIAKSVANDNGTGGTPAGSIFGLNPVAWLTAAATNFVEMDGGEVDIEADAGSSVSAKWGWKISQIATDAVSGSVNDAAFASVNQAGAVGWGTGIQFGDSVSGHNPIKTTGTILALKGSPTIAHGIDLSNATCSSDCFKSTGFAVDGSGNITGLYDTGGAGNTFKLAGTVAGTVVQMQAVLNVGVIRVISRAVNFNSGTTDTAVSFSLPTGISRWSVQGIRLSGASASISTATIGVFTATGGGGQPIAANQAITITQSAADTNNNLMSLTITNSLTEAYSDTTLQIRIGTPQGSAATADVIIDIIPLG